MESFISGGAWKDLDLESDLNFGIWAYLQIYWNLFDIPLYLYEYM